MVMQTSIVCLKCDNSVLITDPESGEIACSKCGLVSSERVLETRPDWRTFADDKNGRIRTGSPVSLAYHDMGLATIIGKTDRDSSGNQLAASMQTTIHRLRTWDFRTQVRSPTDRNLMQAFSTLGKLKDKLGLSDAIIEKTAYVYRKAQEKRLVRGRSTSSILAAAVYIACREMEASRSLKDIAEFTDVKRKDVSRSYRVLVNALGIKVPLADPMKCIAKIANKAKVSEKSKRTAMDIMKDLVHREISAGKLPMGLAATVLYMACAKNGENVTQKDIAESAGVTEVTIRNRIKDLHTKLDLHN